MEFVLQLELVLVEAVEAVLVVTGVVVESVEEKDLKLVLAVAEKLFEEEVIVVVEEMPYTVEEEMVIAFEEMKHSDLFFLILLIKILSLCPGSVSFSVTGSVTISVVVSGSVVSVIFSVGASVIPIPIGIFSLIAGCASFK